jgi:hypothetical protein
MPGGLANLAIRHPRRMALLVLVAFAIAGLHGRPDVLLGGSDVAGEQTGKQATSDLGFAEAIAFPLLAILAFFIFRGVHIGGQGIGAALAGEVEDLVLSGCLRFHPTYETRRGTALGPIDGRSASSKRRPGRLDMHGHAQVAPRPLLRPQASAASSQPVVGLAACRADRATPMRDRQRWAAGRAARRAFTRHEEAVMVTSGHTPAGVTVPDTKLGRDATELVRCGRIR